MNKRFLRAAVIGSSLACGVFILLHAQAQSPQPAQQNPPAPKPPTDANPFPDDTNNVPVMPSSDNPAAAAPAPVGDVHAPAADNDPVHSPDEPVGAPEDTGESSSSTFAGMDKILPPDTDTSTRGKKNKAPQEPEHQETAKEDESVGSYYLSEHNWRAALSRFESAVVLDPENPEVYWGLAEAQRHLGRISEARANYLKLMEYDPDSKHSKDARKILKDPEMANTPASAQKH